MAGSKSAQPITFRFKILLIVRLLWEEAVMLVLFFNGVHILFIV